MDGCDPLPDNLLCAPVTSDASAIVTKGNVDHIYTLALCVVDVVKEN